MNTRKQAMATFERCQHFRELAGLSLSDLVAKLNGRPARSSIARLEDGLAIRASNAFRVANEINSELKKRDLQTFIVDQEVRKI